MELEHFDIVHRCLGQGLTPHELSNIEAGIIKRKAAEKLKCVRFWGRIHGQMQDYLVIVAFLLNEGYPEKKFYFSTLSSPVFQQFPEKRAEHATQLEAFARERFKGDPSLVLNEELTELDRLTHVIAEIDRTISLIPSNAFIVSSTRHVLPNVSFTGLQWEEALHLHNFYHFCSSHDEKHSLWNGFVSVPQILTSAAHDLRGVLFHTKTTRHIINISIGGTLVFYDNQAGLEYKKDGWKWQLRKDNSGRVREDRAKLVIDRKVTILGTYVHSADVSTFHRRSYCIRSPLPRCVMVHYLDEAVQRESPHVDSAIKLPFMENDLTLENKAQDLSNYPESTHLLANNVPLDSAYSLGSIENESIVIEDHTFPSFHPTSNDLGTTNITSSDCIISDTCEETDGFDIFTDRFPKNSLTIPFDFQEHEMESISSISIVKSSALIKIADFSPNWDFLAGGAKILICLALQSNWEMHSSIFVQFGPHIRVSAEHVTSSVFRCTAPQAINAGDVELYMCCIHPQFPQMYLQLTETRVFQYKSDFNTSNKQHTIDSLVNAEYFDYVPSGAKRTRPMDRKTMGFRTSEQQDNSPKFTAENEAWSLSDFVENDFNERQCKIRVVERISEFHDAIQSTSDYYRTNTLPYAPKTKDPTHLHDTNEIDCRSRSNSLSLDDFEIEELSDREIENLSEALLERVMQQLVFVAHTNDDLMEELNSLDEAGLSLLHYVCFYNYARFVPLLISHGAQINQQSTQGQTALHLAAGCGNEEVVHVLMQHGADVLLVDYSQLTAADRAEKSGHIQMANMLRSLMHTNEMASIPNGNGNEHLKPNTASNSGLYSAHDYPSTLAAENRHHNRKLLLGAFSTMSLHDKCALSLGISRQEEEDDESAVTNTSLDSSSQIWSQYSDLDASHSSSCDADVKSVIANEEKHKLAAAMQLMDSEELQSLEDDAKIIQQNVRAWLLIRNYRRMQDTTRKLEEVANTIQSEQQQKLHEENESHLQPSASYPSSYERAAIRVQAATRAMIARKNFLQAKNVTIKVQAATRGALCRKSFSRMKSQTLASLVIQRNVREWWNKLPSTRRYDEKNT